MRFFFNIRERDSLIEDPMGIDFPTLAAAHAEAVIALREIVARMVLKGERIGMEALEIRGMDGIILLVMPFKDAILFE